jgi:hypothetical protein
VRAFRKGVFMAGVVSALVALVAGPASATSSAKPDPARAKGLGAALPVRAGNVGDSYSSGEGGTETGPYVSGSDTPTDQCHRSQTSPTRLLAATGLLKLVADASCSGATTTNITTTGQYGEPPQAAQLDSSLRLAYVVIGGNDIRFGTLAGCFIQTDCDRTPIPAASLQLISQLGPQLDAAYDAVRAHAPNARVVVGLYPRLVPPVGAPVGPNCPELNTAEIALANQIQTALNGVIAARAHAHGFRVADAAPAFVGHDVCSTSSFFYQPSVTGPPAATFHPTLPGRVAMAVAAAVASR